MRYKGLLLCLTLAAIGVACGDDVSGVANDFNVGVGGGAAFSPVALTLATKRPVTFIWGGGPHNVTWEDGAPGSGNKSSGTYERDFTAAAFGTYRFRCTNHSTDFANGMVASVSVP